MDQLLHTIRQIKLRLISVLIVENIVFGGSLYLELKYLSFHTYIDFILSGIIALILVFIIGTIMSNFVAQPLTFLRQAILHISPSNQEPVMPPDMEKLNVGRELVANLTGQLYQLASLTQHELLNSSKDSHDLSHNFLASTMPLPLFVLDKDENIVFSNAAAASYIGIDISELIGKNVYMILDMSFPSEATFDSWLKASKQKAATSSASWERVRLNVRDNHPTLLFDLAAYYNKGNPDGYETYAVIFDHTKQYSQDDQAVSFVALSVHELRTPLTLLRGYIEVFEEELKGKVPPELDDFIQKMRASSEQLTAFVNNILNVARIDDDQLQLKLQKEDWADILNQAISSISLRAKVRGIQLTTTIAPDLPPVGADRLSIQEVINNLIDNAIKYSGKSKQIKINSRLNQEGVVETTVEDFGVGVPDSVIHNLFTKFYRDHRNRAQIGGTGLGLYLSKAIVTAHGGNLWVKSKENEGSTFGFSLVPYDKLSQDMKTTGDPGIVRGAHGWIKNHSYYRR